MGISPPFIDNIKCPETAKEGVEFTITINGNWPNPSWRLSNKEVDVDEDNKIVNVTLDGAAGPGMAIQVLQPVSEEVKITIPTTGAWKIAVKNRSNPIIKEIVVSD
jgi:hypothetical protein